MTTTRAIPMPPASPEAGPQPPVGPQPEIQGQGGQTPPSRMDYDPRFDSEVSQEAWDAMSAREQVDARVAGINRHRQDPQPQPQAQEPASPPAPVSPIEPEPAPRVQPSAEPDNTPAAPSPESLTAEEAATIHELAVAQEVLVGARRELARVRAGRESRTFHGKKYSKKALEAAVQSYETARTAAGAAAVKLLRAQGIEDEAELEKACKFGAVEEALKLTNEQYRSEMANQRPDGKEKTLQFFYDFWAQHSQSKWRSIQGIKDMGWKAAAMAPLGVGLAITIAPAVGVIGGSALAVGLATRLSRALVTSKVSKEAEAKTVAHTKGVDRASEVHGLVNDEQLSYEMLEAALIAKYRQDTNKTANRNRARAAKAAAVAGSVALVSGIAADRIIDGLFVRDTAPKAFSRPSGGTPPEGTGGNGGDVFDPGTDGGNDGDVFDPEAGDDGGDVFDPEAGNDPETEGGVRGGDDGQEGGDAKPEPGDMGEAEPAPTPEEPEVEVKNLTPEQIEALNSQEFANLVEWVNEQDADIRSSQPNISDAAVETEINRRWEEYWFFRHAAEEAADNS